MPRAAAPLSVRALAELGTEAGPAGSGSREYGRLPGRVELVTVERLGTQMRLRRAKSETRTAEKVGERERERETQGEEGRREHLESYHPGQDMAKRYIRV